MERTTGPGRNAPVYTPLGESVSAFDFSAFYALLGSMPTVPDHPSRLLYDFEEIQAAVNQYTIVALRAEAGKAILDKAINARQNAFYAKYANVGDIIDRMKKYYSPSVTDSKVNRLAVLSSLAQQQADALKDAYEHSTPPRTGVVRTTSSVLHSTTSGGGSKVTGQTDMEQLVDDVAPDTELIPPAPGGALPGPLSFDPSGKGTFTYLPVATLQEGSSGETVTNTGEIEQNQKITNTDYGYRFPYVESKAQNERAQISLMDQQFAQFMYSQNFQNLEQVFQNELNSIDGDVYRLQIAFLSTILMSPINGIVTGVYKNPGEAVRAGEPVIRVENNANVLLEGTLIYPGPISIGSEVTITPLADSPISQQGIPPGHVVALRGHQEEDRWQVVVLCLNAGLPLGYCFDYDDTEVSIT